jgi:carbamate kinase
MTARKLYLEDNEIYSMLVVAAIGGNAILRKDEKPTIDGQLKNMRKLSAQLVAIAKKHHLVLTHGNGPQVGNILIRVEEALGKAYPLPLYACVAESQGEIGYMIEQSLQNELRQDGMRKHVVTILTQATVDRDDPSFQKPTKPVGPFYTKKEADSLMRKGFDIAKDPRGGYRRVVASPKPLKIVEATTIKELIADGVIVVAAGGGGIPVYEKNGLHGVDAVIDKDLASACLAKSIKADVLLILTDIDYAYLDFKKPTQKKLTKIKIGKIKKYMKNGHFPAGSMGPKIEAAINFLESGGRMAIITSPENAEKALSGKAGTVITK